MSRAAERNLTMLGGKRRAPRPVEAEADDEERDERENGDAVPDPRRDAARDEIGARSGRPEECGREDVRARVVSQEHRDGRDEREGCQRAGENRHEKLAERPGSERREDAERDHEERDANGRLLQGVAEKEREKRGAPREKEHAEDE